MSSFLSTYFFIFPPVNSCLHFRVGHMPIGCWLFRCECMLALWMLHVDNLDVLFVDEDRLEVLRHASARDVLI